MPTIDGKLKPNERPMTEEEWEVNKVCGTSKRAHKWQWKFDGKGATSADKAICVHCGFETTLTRRDGDRE
jgi:hypothetical protein